MKMTQFGHKSPLSKHSILNDPLTKEISRESINKNLENDFSLKVRGS